MAGPLAAPAGAGAALYVGGAAVAAGALYLMGTPEYREAAGSLGDAVSRGAGEAIDDVRDLVWGEEEAPAAPATGTDAGAATATGEQTCPARPFWHFTSSAAMATILSARAFYGARNHFADRPWGPSTIFYTVFEGIPTHADRPHHYVSMNADCTVPLVPGKAWGEIVQEFIHAGRLNERPPHVIITGGGPNGFPEFGEFGDYPIPDPIP